tara:strand:- start:287 stop:397 length:111 start_codon:yes stop_codon:yes gene_type:complete
MAELVDAADLKSTLRVDYMWGGKTAERGFSKEKAEK